MDDVLTQDDCLGGPDRAEQCRPTGKPENDEDGRGQLRERIVEHARAHPDGPPERAGKCGQRDPTPDVQGRQVVAQGATLGVGEDRALSRATDHNGQERHPLVETSDRGHPQTTVGTENASSSPTVVASSQRRYVVMAPRQGVAGGTASTGQWATCSSRCVTLPKSTPATAEWPRVPATIRSAFTSSAISAIA
jgi:hypothetical protein